MGDPADKLRALNEDTFKAEAKHDIGGTPWDQYLHAVLADDFILRRSRADAEDEIRAAMITRIAGTAWPVDREIVPGSVRVWRSAGVGVVVSVVTLPDEAGNRQAFQNIKVCTPPQREGGAAPTGRSPPDPSRPDNAARSHRSSARQGQPAAATRSGAGQLR